MYDDYGKEHTMLKFPKTFAPLIFMALASSAVPMPQGDDLSSEPERIARGKTSYRIYCRNCHGKDGKGDGSIADLLKIPPSDLTQLTARNGNFPDDLIYQVIDGRQEIKGHGRREMPIWGIAFQSTDRDSDQEEEVRQRILDVVTYIKSIQAKGDS